MHTLQKVIKVITINFAILVLLIEIVSIATYYLRNGSLFYANHTNDVEAVLLTPEPIARHGSGQQIAVQQLHPYFGFIDKVGTDHRFPYSHISHLTNNLGFASIHGYPFTKQNRNQFIVGVFGGSVAANYSVFELERNILAGALQSLPGLANKEIIILPFAIGAYKQPQQLLVLSYFLSIGQEFDLVINIDGFNEVTLAYLNYQHGIEDSMPSDFIFLPMVNLATGTLSKEELEITLEIVREKETLGNCVKSLETSRIASQYTVSWLRAHYLLRKYRQDIAKLDQLRVSKGRPEQSYMQLPIASTLGENEVFPELVERWSRSSRMMKHILSQRNIPYFQFIQPNQYAQSQRVFSQKEKTIAIDDASPFTFGVQKGYPLLLIELGKLQQAGLNAFSAVNVFDDVIEPVYQDNCCHYNESGNLIFCKYVASAVLNTLNKDARFK